MPAPLVHPGGIYKIAKVNQRQKLRLDRRARVKLLLIIKSMFIDAKKDDTIKQGLLKPRWERMTTKKLSHAEQEFYRANGYVTPVRAIDGDFARELGRKVEQLDPEIVTQKKLHLLLKWVGDLMRTPAILDAVEDLLGPNLLVWGTALFYKRPRDPAFVSWHQDATYWGLQPPDVTTAWIALSPSTKANGAMRVIPGTHLNEQLPHRDTFAEHNLLQRGQEIAVEVDQSLAAMCELQPGEMSLHHIMLVHGSDPNPSDECRIGLAIRYIGAHVRQINSIRDTATLVRGEDKHHNFDLEEAPDADLSASAREYHRSVIRGYESSIMASNNLTVPS